MYLILQIRSLSAVIYGYLGAFGITAGAHRHWAHKAYKAKWPLKLILMICNTIAFQNSLYEWVRDHRYVFKRQFQIINTFLSNLSKS